QNSSIYSTFFSTKKIVLRRIISSPSMDVTFSAAEGIPGARLQSVMSLLLQRSDDRFQRVAGLWLRFFRRSVSGRRIFFQLAHPLSQLLIFFSQLDDRIAHKAYDVLLHLCMIGHPFMIFGKIHIKQVAVLTKILLHDLPVTLPIPLHEFQRLLRR